MNLPKFTPTKWKIKFCLKCKCRESWQCRREEHEIIEIENVPFFIPKVKILRCGWHGWWTLESDLTKEIFPVSASNMEPIVLKNGIEPNGEINNRWWMWCKMGGSLSLKMMQVENENTEI